MPRIQFFQSKTKHVDTKYHFIGYLVVKYIIKPRYFPCGDQTSNIFTKPFGKTEFTKFKDELGVCKYKLLD